MALSQGTCFPIPCGANAYQVDDESIDQKQFRLWPSRCACCCETPLAQHCLCAYCRLCAGCSYTYILVCSSARVCRTSARMYRNNVPVQVDVLQTIARAVALQTPHTMQRAVYRTQNHAHHVIVTHVDVGNRVAAALLRHLLLC